MAAEKKSYQAQVTVDNLIVFVSVSGGTLEEALTNSHGIGLSDVMADTSEVLDYELRISGVYEKG